MYLQTRAHRRILVLDRSRNRRHVGFQLGELVCIWRVPKAKKQSEPRWNGNWIGPVLAVSAHFQHVVLVSRAKPCVFCFSFEEFCSLQRRLAFSLFVLPSLLRWKGSAGAHATSSLGSAGAGAEATTKCVCVGKGICLNNLHAGLTR